MTSPAYGETVVGRGEPALFLPGAGLSGLEGLSLADALADGLRMHLVDLPGAGGSAPLEGRATWRSVADWIAAYLDARGIDRVTAIGHSLGAICLVALADRHPHRIRRLVLLDGGHADLPRMPVGEMGPIAVLAPLVAALEPLVGPRMLRVFAKSTRAHAAANEVQARKRASAWAAMIGARVDLGYVVRTHAASVGLAPDAMAVALAMYRARPGRRLAESRVPTLLVYATWPSKPALGRRSRACVGRLLAARPDVQAVAAEGGHFVHWVDPERVGDAIRAFVT